MRPRGSILWLLVAGLGFWAAARLSPDLSAARRRAGVGVARAEPGDPAAPHAAHPGRPHTHAFASSAVPLENASPLMAFTTVALGGFRGLIVDGLWIRITHLQREGQYFEIVQLADWITKLEPHFSAVWAYHAWNMAYNISILFPDPEDRWRWVQQGIRLLRDEGLTYNPRDPELYRELGWLYQHKIGYLMDSAHPFFKMRLAQDLHAVLGGPRPDYRAPPSDARLLRLRREYKLDPEVMETLEARYGPLDWRKAETHALYWAWRGRALAAAEREAWTCELMLVQCAAEQFRSGRLSLRAGDEPPVMTPRLDLADAVARAYDAALAHYDKPMLRAAYAGFLGEAAVVLSVYERESEARAAYARLLNLRASPQAPAEDCDRFVARCLAHPVGELSPAIAAALVEGFFYQGGGWIARGDPARADACARRAERIWTDYSNSRAGEDHRVRTGLPPLDLLRQLAAERRREEMSHANP